MGSAVPSRVSLLISILRLNLVFTYGIPPEFRGGVHLFIFNGHTSSGQSRVYRVTLLRTNGVHCRESAGTGPVNLKVVPNECCLGRSPWTNYYASLFPTPTIDMKCTIPYCPTLRGAVLLLNRRWQQDNVINIIRPVYRISVLYRGRHFYFPCDYGPVIPGS